MYQWVPNVFTAKYPVTRVSLKDATESCFANRYHHRMRDLVRAWLCRGSDVLYVVRLQ